MRLPVVLLLCAVVGGCFGAGETAAQCPRDSIVATPQVDGLYMQTDARQSWQTVVLSPANNATTTTTLAWSAPAGWTASGHVLSAPGERVFQVATIEPGTASANATLAFEVRSSDGGCKSVERGSVVWDLAAPKPGTSAGPGQGVHVMTAGFFENGTLFYTNIAEIDGDGRWPRVDWYAWEGDAPLPVYVYDANRTEQPAVWKAPSSQVPKTGNPAADENLTQTGGAADAATGLGYFTTIAGFNSALKGLSTTTTRVVRLAPEEAYTRPGNEAHPLYGAAIVFYIKVLDVVDAPCPTMVQAWMCEAGLPLARGE